MEKITSNMKTTINQRLIRLFSLCYGKQVTKLGYFEGILDSCSFDFANNVCLEYTDVDNCKSTFCIKNQSDYHDLFFNERSAIEIIIEDLLHDVGIFSTESSLENRVKRIVDLLELQCIIPIESMNLKAWLPTDFLRKSTKPKFYNISPGLLTVMQSELYQRIKLTIAENRWENLEKQIEQLTKISEPRLLFLKAIYSSEPDVQIICMGEEKLFAHKFILAARSIVFAELFTVSPKTKPYHEVFMQNHSRAAFKVFLQLLYAQPCPDLKDHIAEILELFDRFKIANVKGIIGDKTLINIISEDNAIELFFTAAKYKQMDIWTMVYQFIKDHYAVLNSEKWKNYKRNGIFLTEEGIDAIF